VPFDFQIFIRLELKGSSQNQRTAQHWLGLNGDPVESCSYQRLFLFGTCLTNCTYGRIRYCGYRPKFSKCQRALLFLSLLLLFAKKIQLHSKRCNHPPCYVVAVGIAASQLPPLQNTPPASPHPTYDQQLIVERF